MKPYAIAQHPVGMRFLISINIVKRLGLTSHQTTGSFMPEKSSYS